MGQSTRQYRRESDWRSLLAQWRRTGISVRAFCRAQDVSEPSFYLWRRKLNLTDRTTPTFIPVDVVCDEAKEAATLGIEVVLSNGRCLRVGPGFDPHTLLSVVDLLERGGISC